MPRFVKAKTCFFLIILCNQNDNPIHTFFFLWLKEMWPLNKCVFYVQIQAAKPVYSDSSLDKLFCLTNRKPGNQLWQLGSVHEIYIFLRGHVSFKYLLSAE